MKYYWPNLTMNVFSYACVFIWGFHSLMHNQIMFNLDKVHIILDEMILNGHIVETNKNRILAPLLALDKMAESWSNANEISLIFCYKLYMFFTSLNSGFIFHSFTKLFNNFDVTCNNPNALSKMSKFLLNTELPENPQN